MRTIFSKIFFLALGITLITGLLNGGAVQTAAITFDNLLTQLLRSMGAKAFNFSLSMDSYAGTVVQGNSASATVYATLLSGRPKSVRFTASGLPSKATASFSPTNCTTTCSSALTITTAPDTPIGNYLITITAAAGKTIKTAGYTLTVAVPGYTLTVNKSGVGDGTVTAPVGAGDGINCGFNCAEDYNSGTLVTLTQSANGSSVLAGWSGDADCLDGTVTMNTDKTCTARFNLGNQLAINKAGAGSGTVTSSPTGINCGGDCLEYYTPGTVVGLTVSPAGGSTFAGWSGACSGGDLTINITMDVPKNCTATFNLRIFDLTVNKNPATGGTITASGGTGPDTVINCGTDCTGTYDASSTLTLTATAAAGYTLYSWTGCDSPSGNSCTMTMNANKTVTANFNTVTYNIIVVPANERIIESFNFETNPTASSSWFTDAWKPTEAQFVWDTIGHATSSRSIGITLNTANDARWVHNAALDPTRVYRLSGWLKGENIVNVDNGTAGANLNALTWEKTQDRKGTFDWVKDSFIFIGGSGITDIKCRLGFFWNTVTGKAWCDDITLAIDPLTKYEGSRIMLFLEPGDLTNITDGNMKQWVINLDKTYNAYLYLTGYQPYPGQKISILSVTQYPGGWAVAGNPIKWMQTYVGPELARINTSGDWSFGILHEIGHDFDLAAWNFDAEFWANTKMYYAIETLNGKVWEGSKYYTGSELKTYYQTDAGGSYDKTLKLGVYSGDGLTYKFIYIKDQIGLEPFRQTFRYFASLAQDPATKLDKFNLFIDKLTAYSGQNVRNMFPSIEMNAITAELSK